jgi:hypothetical protein
MPHKQMKRISIRLRHPLAIKESMNERFAGHKRSRISTGILCAFPTGFSFMWRRQHSLSDSGVVPGFFIFEKPHPLAGGAFGCIDCTSAVAK